MTQVKKVKHLMFNESDQGVIGTLVPNYDKQLRDWNGKYAKLHVGDIVRYKATSSSKEYTGVVCRHDRDSSKYSIMGWYSADVRDSNVIKVIDVVVPHQFVTNEILGEFHSPAIHINEETVVSITLEELRQYVPFEFELKQ